MEIGNDSLSLWNNLHPVVCYCDQGRDPITEVNAHGKMSDVWRAERQSALPGSQWEHLLFVLWNQEAERHRMSSHPVTI